MKESYKYTGFLLGLCLAGQVNAAALEAARTGLARGSRALSYASPSMTTMTALSDFYTPSHHIAPRRTLTTDSSQNNLTPYATYSESRTRGPTWDALKVRAEGIYGPVGRYVGTPWIRGVGLSPSEKITGFEVYAGERVDALKFYISTSTDPQDSAGGRGGGLKGKVKFDKNEYLIGILGKGRDALYCIAFETFIKTPDGKLLYRYYGPYGKEDDGDKFRLSGSGVIFKVWGTYGETPGIAGNVIKSIGIETRLQ